MSDFIPLPRSRAWTRVVVAIGLVSLQSSFLGYLITKGRDYRTILLFSLLQIVLLLSPFFIAQMESLILVFVGLMALGVLGELVSGGATLLPLVGIWLGLLWASQLLLHRRDLVWAPEFKWLGIYGALVAVSSTFGLDRENSLRALLTTFQLILLAFLIVQIVREPKWAFAIGWILIGSLTVTALLSLGSAFGVWQLYGIQVYGYEYGYGAYVRVGGIVGGVNTASIALLVGIIFAAAYLTYYRQGVIRIILVLCLSIMTLANILAGSLSAIFALAVALALLASRIYGTRRIWNYLTFLIAVVVVMGLLWLFPVVQQRVIHKVWQAEVTQNPGYLLSSRVGTWYGAIEVARRYPLLGVGLKNAQYLIPQYWLLPLDDRHGAHNAYLSIAADAGIPAMLAFVLFALNALRGLHAIVVGESKHLFHSAFKRDRLDAVAMATFVSLIALLFIAALPQSIERLPYLWLLLGLAIAIRLQAKGWDGAPQ